MYGADCPIEATIPVEQMDQAIIQEMAFRAMMNDIREEREDA